MDKFLIVVAVVALITSAASKEETVLYVPAASVPSDLSSLSITDPLLRSIYALALTDAGTPRRRGMEPASVVPWKNRGYKDIARRGNEVAPLLLDIMEKESNSHYESGIFAAVSTIETINLEPFLDHWRSAIRERYSEPLSYVSTVAGVFAEFGNDSDIELIKWFTEVRPDWEARIHRSLETQRRSLMRRGKTIPKPLVEWELDRNLDAVAGSVDEFKKLTSEELQDRVRQHDKKIADQMAAADPPPPPAAVETPPAQKAPEKSNARPPTGAEKTPSPPSGGGTGFAVGLAAGALALLAGVWFVLRRKSA